MTTTMESPPPEHLARSYAFCQELTRREARNFYYALRLLPEPKRSAMYALYAWMRLVDDIADNEDGRPAERRAADLEAFRAQTHAATDAHCPDSHEIWPAFADIVGKYGIPLHLFDDVIAGQVQDLRPIEFQTFAELHQYCYRVAGAVGLASIHIWGCEGIEQIRELAIARGVAFQLTNILRDLCEDAARGRVYLPQDELAAHGLMAAELIRLCMDAPASRSSFSLFPSSFSPPESFLNLMRFQIGRAESFYNHSAPLDARIARDSRPALLAMTGIYHGLLAKISRDPSCVLRRRVSLSLIRKLLIASRALRS